MRLVFLHVPKTGGTSFKEMFGIRTIKYGVRPCAFPVSYHHKNLVEVSAKIDLRDCFTVAFVRNPWERFVSWYLFHCRTAKKEISFAEFLTEFLPAERRRGSFQHPYLFAEDWNVSWICRFERFDDECLRLARILGREVRVRHDQRAPFQYDYRDFYTPALRRYVDRTFSADLELLKYRF